MFETLDKMMLAGLGAMSMSREKAEKIFDEYVARGQAEKAHKTGFVKDLLDSADKTRKELEEIIARQVREGMTRMDLPTREDFQRLEQKIDALMSRCDSMHDQQGS